MMLLKTALLASSLVLCGALTASAQTGTMSGPARGTSTPNVSAMTHCRDANGNIQLKSAMNNSGSGALSGSGSTSGGLTGGTVGSSGMGSSGSSTLGSAGTAGTSGTGGTSGSTSTGVGSSSALSGSTSTAAADLPSCN